MPVAILADAVQAQPAPCCQARCQALCNRGPVVLAAAGMLQDSDLMACLLLCCCCEAGSLTAHRCGAFFPSSVPGPLLWLQVCWRMPSRHS